MKLQKLNISNIGPFGEENVIDFSRYTDNDLVLIIGDNRDSPGADSNGAGKTWLLNAISWGYFGKIPKSSSADDVIRRQSKQAQVTIEAKDDRDRLHVITRTRDLKKGEDLVWSVDGQTKGYTFNTRTQTEKALLSFLGIEENNKDYFDDFLNTTYFSVDAVKAFAGKDSKSSDRMALISRFLKAETLDRALSLTRVKMNNLKGEIQVVQGNIEHLESKLESESDERELRRSIKEAKQRVETKRGQIKELKLELDSIERKAEIIAQIEQFEWSMKKLQQDSDTVVKAYESSIKDSRERLKKKDEYLEKIEEKERQVKKFDLQKKIEKSNKYSRELKKGSEALLRENDKLKKVQKQLQNSLTCPECESPLMFSGNKLISFDRGKLKEEETETQNKVEEYKEALGKIQTGSDKLDTQIEEIRFEKERIKNLYNLVDSLKGIPEAIEKNEKLIKKNREDLSANQKELEHKINQTKVKLLKLPNVDVDSKKDMESLIETYEKQLNNSIDEISRNEAIIQSRRKDQKRIEELRESIKNSSKELSNLQFWERGFPEIKRWMIDNFLPELENQTNHYLSLMEVQMRVEFNTLKKKKKKSKNGEEYSEKFDISILDDNKESRPLETYSSGETKRIGVCSGFALRELTFSKGYNSFGFLMMDEVVDSLDETGVNEFFNLLNKVSGLKLLISHDSGLKSRFGNVIRAIKEGGLTTIKQE